MVERVLEVLDANGRLSNKAPGVVLGRMYHPEDEGKAKLLAATWFQVQCHHQGVVPPGEIAQITLEGGGLPIAEQQADQAANHGMIVGDVLIHYARLAEHKPEDASKHKAMWLARTGRSDNLRNKKEYYWTQTKLRLPSSRQTVVAAWRSHGPTAHLWAAFCLTDKLDPPIEPEQALDPEVLPNFLGIARAFFEIGKPVLGPRPWIVPSSPDIPKIELVLSALNADEIALLADYRHHPK